MSFACLHVKELQVLSSGECFFRVMIFPSSGEHRTDPLSFLFDIGTMLLLPSSQKVFKMIVLNLYTYAQKAKKNIYLKTKKIATTNNTIFLFLKKKNPGQFCQEASYEVTSSQLDQKVFKNKGNYWLEENNKKLELSRRYP